MLVRGLLLFIALLSRDLVLFSRGREGEGKPLSLPHLAEENKPQQQKRALALFNYFEHVECN